MNVIGVQYDIEWENKQANYEKVRSLLRNMVIQPGSLIVLPEMFATGFSMNVEGIVEETDGPSEQFLRSVAQQYQSTVLGGVVTPSSDSRGLNQAIVIDSDGRLLCRYTKMQPFTLSGEADNYQAGEKPMSFSWGEFTVAPFICYDLRFPEIFRHATQHGANLICVIACWPYPRDEHWATLLRARAIENQSYVVGVNRCGKDPKFLFPGRSRILDPWGNVLQEAGYEEGIITASLDIQRLTAYREKFPALGDMRPEYRFS